MRSQEAALVSIVASAPRGALGFLLADMAGRGVGARSERGRAMLRNLESKASRFVYPGFEKREQNVADGVQRILNKYAERVNVKLRVM
jgi:hypothetical protein